VIEAPVIDARDRATIEADLIARIPGYVPEWTQVAGSDGQALLSILARNIEIQAAAENGMPDRARLEFLDMLGNSLLPAQSAVAPLVFTLMSNAPQDVTLQQNSEIAAKLPPPPPSLTGAAQASSSAPLFSTQDTITLARAGLTTVYSVDPSSDTYQDASATQTTGFALFGNMQPVPHQIYLGHDSMFAITSGASIELSFDLATALSDSTPRPLLIDWEYLSQDGWLPLRLVQDQTRRLTTDGRITLQLDSGPDAQQSPVQGINSYWIRGTVSARVPSGLIGPYAAGYPITWSSSPTLILGRLVKIQGTASTATITAIAQSTITLNRPLQSVQAGAMLVDATTNANVGVVSQVIGGGKIILVGVDPGTAITIDGTTVSNVIDGGGNIAVLDTPLPASAAKNAQISDAVSGLPLGILSAVPAGYSMTLDDASDFLVGDVVTVDGNTQATLTDAGAQVVTLSGPITSATQGNFLTLANALPVLRPQGADSSGVLPSVSTIRARVGFTKSGVLPDGACCDAAPLDTSNTFYPFGKFPQQYTTFYLGCDEVFKREGAQVTITVTLAAAGVGYDDSYNPQPGQEPTWSIEYFNGTLWMPLGSYQKLIDSTVAMTVGSRTQPETITFLCPLDWAQSEVNGQKSRWLRMRIDDGNYGQPMHLSVSTSGGTTSITSVPPTLAPPAVAALSLAYTYFTNSNLVNHCLTYNDFAFTDHSEDAQWPRRQFQPFTPVADLQAAVHFGFSQALPVGLVSLYFDAANPLAVGPGAAINAGAASQSGSPFVWEYFSPNGWVELSVLDETTGFAQSGMIQFIGPPDAAPLEGLNGLLYWVRARLKPDLPTSELNASAIWLNAVWANQSQSVQDDTLGSSNGDPGQTFLFAPMHVPVLPGESILVREWTGAGDDWRTAVAGVPQSQLTFEVDPVDGTTVTAVWVTWQEVPYFYLSGPANRHYVLERSTGVLEFGSPPYGMIPPGGALIQASFQTGGGLIGNVAAGTISELHSSASYVQSVTNPIAASGGSATEIAPQAERRATARLRHRDRAVSLRDYEWLACEASPEVARARCLPITGPDGRGELGYVKLVVVPNDTVEQPLPSPGLLSAVEVELAARVPASIVGNISLLPPTYTPISVRAEIVPTDADDAALVEARVRDALGKFLHPLTGGAAGNGWDFGEAVYVSQVATLLSGIAGVDYVPLLQLLVDDSVAGDAATTDAGALPCEGNHQIKLLAVES
jgi:Baseplate J-like protein